MLRPYSEHLTILTHPLFLSASVSYSFFQAKRFFIFIVRGGPSYVMGRCAQITKHTSND